MNESVLHRLRQNPKDLLVIASWFYKIGMPIIEDSEYNTIASTVGDIGVVWDELEKPQELLDRYGIQVEDESEDSCIGSNPYFNQYMESLYDAGTKSCNPAYNEDDIYNRMMGLKSVTDELVISLKVDGVSTRNIIEEDGDWNLVASLSRSRVSKGFDYTEGMKLSVRQNLTFPKDAGEIHEHSGKRVLFAFGEAYVERSALQYLREKYNAYDTWKTPRSTALSMLRNVIDKEDYKYLKFKCFKLNVGETLSEMFHIAEDAGLDVVPYEVIRTADIPTDYISWQDWFNNLVDKYYKIQIDEDIEADGIVVAINNQNQFNTLGESSDGRYNNGMFSCKVGPWGSKTYTSVVTKIHFDNTGNTSEFSIVAEVEPVVVANGNTVTRVNCFNPKILIENKINVGSYIRFEYKSASSIVLVYR